jgi:type IV secretory pathway TraG/TraD family ATPase VirD4
VSTFFAEPTDYVDFQNWQKLTLKRMAASVMFPERALNAQIIMESARDLLTRQV